MPPLVVAIDARLLGTRNTGDTSYWRGLVQGLSETGVDAEFLLFTNQSRPEKVPDDPRFRTMHVPSPINRWWSYVVFPRAARAAGAHVLHTQYNVSPIAARQTVTTVHDVSFFVEPSWFKPKDRYLLQTQIPASIKRAAHVLTVSETSKAEIERFIPSAKGKTTVTYNALGPQIQPVEKTAAQREVKDRLGIDPPYLFTLGTRWPRKNLALAIQTAALLPENFPHRLVVGGQPGWGDLPRNHRTVFPGYLEDDLVSALYSAADLYLAPSLHEGFGIPLLEAWACGCPVLCGPGGALPEIGGDAVILAPDFEPETWAGLVTEALADSSKLAAMRERGHQRLHRFSWRETAEKTLEVYQNVRREGTS